MQYNSVTCINKILNSFRLPQWWQKYKEVKPTEPAYIYVLVRNDLTPRQQTVQACHASIESSRHYLRPTDEHPSIIICSVKNEQKLLSCAKELQDKGIAHEIFYEPDIGSQATALASRPLAGDDRKAFARFQLMQ